MSRWNELISEEPGLAHSREVIRRAEVELARQGSRAPFSLRPFFERAVAVGLGTMAIWLGVRAGRLFSSAPRTHEGPPGDEFLTMMENKSFFEDLELLEELDVLQQWPNS